MNTPKQIFPGIFRLSFGIPEEITPVKLTAPKSWDKKRLAALPHCKECPVSVRSITFKATSRGSRLTLPLKDGEDVYGFGLQLKSLCQTMKKRTLRVNSDPSLDLGDSHAPLPLYFSTEGYGVFVDTARYAVFYTGGNAPVQESRSETKASDIKLTEAELYAGENKRNPIVIDVPVAQGMDIYIFAGPSLLEAIRRYILFSGGGCLVPEWGLGMNYRICGKADEKEALRIANLLRKAKVPCDVIGLEPGWQTHAYPCTYVWSPERFPNHEKLTRQLHRQGYHVNLWEHLFLDESAPLYTPLKKCSGDYKVFNGIVPDLFVEKSGNAYTDYHEKKLVSKGIDAFKLDECDNSDFICFPWSFPECSEFPSGCDGEQMHSLLGVRYQKVIQDAFLRQKKRTLGNARNSHAFSSSLPFVLYSDLYEHKDFLRGVMTAGFCGMLWTPELRSAASEEDYLRRLQSLILAPQFLMNIWAMPNPPWTQLNEEKNRNGELLPEKDRKRLLLATRKAVELRMKFIPYLYNAFMEYYFDGMPPCRALVTDEPENPKLRNCDRAWLTGRDLISAPLVAGETSLTIPLPAGNWYDFYTGKIFSGEATLTPALDELPVLVRENTTLPLADIKQYCDGGAFKLSIKSFGPAPRPAHLFADDGLTMTPSRSSFGMITADGKMDEVLKKRYTLS